MPRNKPRVEYVSITPDGFRYRGRVHGNVNNLLKWFKEHFRDAVPGSGKLQYLIHVCIISNLKRVISQLFGEKMQLCESSYH